MSASEILLRQSAGTDLSSSIRSINTMDNDFGRGLEGIYKWLGYRLDEIGIDETDVRSIVAFFSMDRKDLEDEAESIYKQMKDVTLGLNLPGRTKFTSFRGQFPSAMSSLDVLRKHIAEKYVHARATARVAGFDQLVKNLMDELSLKMKDLSQDREMPFAPLNSNVSSPENYLSDFESDSPRDRYNKAFPALSDRDSPSQLSPPINENNVWRRKSIRNGEEVVRRNGTVAYTTERSVKGVSVFRKAPRTSYFDKENEARSSSVQGKKKPSPSARNRHQHRSRKEQVSVGRAVRNLSWPPDDQLSERDKAYCQQAERELKTLLLHKPKKSLDQKLRILAKKDNLVKVITQQEINTYCYGNLQQDEWGLEENSDSWNSPCGDTEVFHENEEGKIADQDLCIRTERVELDLKGSVSNSSNLMNIFVDRSHENSTSGNDTSDHQNQPNPTMGCGLLQHAAIKDEEFNIEALLPLHLFPGQSALLDPIHLQEVQDSIMRSALTPVTQEESTSKSAAFDCIVTHQSFGTCGFAFRPNEKPALVFPSVEPLPISLVRLEERELYAAFSPQLGLPLPSSTNPYSPDPWSQLEEFPEQPHFYLPSDLEEESADLSAGPSHIDHHSQCTPWDQQTVEEIYWDPSVVYVHCGEQTYSPGTDFSNKPVASWISVWQEKDSVYQGSYTFSNIPWQLSPSIAFSDTLTSHSNCMVNACDRCPEDCTKKEMWQQFLCMYLMQHTGGIIPPFYEQQPHEEPFLDACLTQYHLDKYGKCGSLSSLAPQSELYQLQNLENPQGTGYWYIGTDFHLAHRFNISPQAPDTATPESAQKSLGHWELGYSEDKAHLGHQMSLSASIVVSQIKEKGDLVESYTSDANQMQKLYGQGPSRSRFFPHITLEGGHQEIGLEKIGRSMSDGILLPSDNSAFDVFIRTSSLQSLSRQAVPDRRIRGKRIEVQERRFLPIQDASLSHTQDEEISNTYTQQPTHDIFGPPSPHVNTAFLLYHPCHDEVECRGSCKLLPFVYRGNDITTQTDFDSSTPSTLHEHLSHKEASVEEQSSNISNGDMLGNDSGLNIFVPTATKEKAPTKENPIITMWRDKKWKAMEDTVEEDKHLAELIQQHYIKRSGCRLALPHVSDDPVADVLHLEQSAAVEHELSQVNGLVCVVPMPARAYLVTDLEREMLEVDHGTLSAVSLKTRKPKYSKGSANSSKPCTFYLEGQCYRMDCKYSHDLSTITCRFWEDGLCFKGDMCPFLHGYLSEEENVTQPRNPKENFRLLTEDFPELSCHNQDVLDQSIPPLKKKKNTKKLQVRHQIPRGT